MNRLLTMVICVGFLVVSTMITSQLLAPPAKCTPPNYNLSVEIGVLAPGICGPGDKTPSPWPTSS